MNDDHDKEMLNENTNNFQGQKSLTYVFSTIDKVAKEGEDVKSSLCNLKLRNLNRLISVKSILTPSEISLSHFSPWLQMMLMCY